MKLIPWREGEKGGEFFAFDFEFNSIEYNNKLQDLEARQEEETSSFRALSANSNSSPKFEIHKLCIKQKHSFERRHYIGCSL